jgi:hypothetical protein
MYCIAVSKQRIMLLIRPEDYPIGRMCMVLKINVVVF